MRKQPLVEQTAVHTSARSAGATYGLHPEDDPAEERDALYTTRSPSSVRRYHAPPPPTTAETRTHKRTVLSVHQYEGLPSPHPTKRASRTTTHAPQQPPAPRQRPASPVVQKRPALRPHWLLLVGMTMMASVVLWIIGCSAVSWVQTEHDTLTYGYPRTFQIDADVQHGGISHFIAVNLHGHILVTEINENNLAETKVYSGPVFTGNNADTLVATLSFKDLGNGKPDMILQIGNQRYILINTGSAFRDATPADKINAWEVN